VTEVSEPRSRLNRAAVLDSAVRLADEIGIDALSMRRLAQELGVVPMALYKHVRNKEELLDGMVEVVIGEIDPPLDTDDWRAAVRERVLSARRVLMGHQWARRVFESRTTKTPAVLDYMDSFVGMFLAGGLSIDLTHHVMHAIGGRMWGFTQEIFEDAPADGHPSPPSDQAIAMMRVRARHPPRRRRWRSATRTSWPRWSRRHARRIRDLRASSGHDEGAVPSSRDDEASVGRVCRHGDCHARRCRRTSSSRGAGASRSSRAS
jgi:AcrR family transcriptional regulator